MAWTLLTMEGVSLPHRISTLRSGTTTESRSTTKSRTLDTLSESARTCEGIWADDVQPGDWLVVRTRNSTYSLTSLGNGLFRVSGGWFLAQGFESVDIRILGCTWGGRAILTRLVAAPGMCIEFDNTVQTTSVREVRLFRHRDTDVCH
jgi:hypothetical protein